MLFVRAKLRSFGLIVLSTFAAITLFAALASAATTINTNIQTDGALTVSGGASVGADYNNTSAPTNGLIVEGVSGIGTSTPTTGDGAALVVVGGLPIEAHSTFANGANFYSHSNTGFRGPVINLNKSRGTEAAPAALQAGDTLGYLEFGGYNGSTYTNAAAWIIVTTAENWTGSANGSIVKFFNTSAGNNAAGTVMTFNGSSIGINDNTPGVRLSVVGNAAVGYSSGQTAPTNGLVISGKTGIGTSTPATQLQVSSGASATTTVTVGELGLSSSKACVNMNQANGSPGSFYIANGAIVVENNYCR